MAGYQKPNRGALLEELAPVSTSVGLEERLSCKLNLHHRCVVEAYL